MYRASLQTTKVSIGKGWRAVTALAVVVSALGMGLSTPAEARSGGGTKTESQKQAGKSAVARTTKALKTTKAEKAARKNNFERVAVPAGPLPPTVMAALARAHVPLSSMSVVVQRIGAGGVPLVALNANVPMMPASTMKLVTTYSGLSLLGPDYRWKTTAYADGEVDANGILHGNLYVQGTGDPKLVPEELIDLVDQIRRNGISGIDGALVLDKRYFDPSTRDLPAFDADETAPYNVGPDPLLYAFKSLSFTLTPNPEGGVSIDVLPQLAQLQIDNELRVTRGACAG
ncbi:D-alanyl-D-alanine carboxypeptidase/D-alanyl-D-alanine-endopeptidase, partial [Caballeronia sp. M23-90]